MDIGFTGSRLGFTGKQIDKFKEVLWNISSELDTFHHGDCVGCDQEAHNIAKKYNLTTVIHPPIKDTLRAYCDGHEFRQPQDYLDRNYNIAKMCDVIIAVPKENTEVKRSGTWSTIRYAKKLGKYLYIIYPNGRVELNE